MSDIDTFKRAVKAGKTARNLPEGKTVGSPVKGGEGAANRCLAMLSTAFNLAIKWGWRTTNPVKQVGKYKERKVERREGSNPYPLAAIKLLIFTGARRNEILTLKWDQINFDLGVISLSDSKTGAKPIYLNAPAKEVLAHLPRQKGNAFVICGSIPGAHLVNIRKPWCRIRDKATLELWKREPTIADYIKNYNEKHKKQPTLPLVMQFAAKQQIQLSLGLRDVRLHDLRHSFASIAVGGGMSLPMIGKLLGHTQTTTTERYAHLADNPLKEANDAVGNRLQALMEQPSSDNVVRIKNT